MPATRAASMSSGSFVVARSSSSAGLYTASWSYGLACSSALLRLALRLLRERGLLRRDRRPLAAWPFHGVRVVACALRFIPNERLSAAEDVRDERFCTTRNAPVELVAVFRMGKEAFSRATRHVLATCRTASLTLWLALRLVMMNRLLIIYLRPTTSLLTLWLVLRLDMMNRLLAVYLGPTSPLLTLCLALRLAVMNRLLTLYLRPAAFRLSMMNRILTVNLGPAAFLLTWLLSIVGSASPLALVIAFR